MLEEKDEYIQYYIINQSLLEHKDHPMSDKKAAAQVGHGALMVHRHHDKEEEYLKWFNDGVQKKIILKAKEAKLEKWLQQEEWKVYPVIDLGYNEIPPNSMTAIVFHPYLKSKIHPLLKRYRLF